MRYSYVYLGFWEQVPEQNITHHIKVKRKRVRSGQLEGVVTLLAFLRSADGVGDTKSEYFVCCSLTVTKNKTTPLVDIHLVLSELRKLHRVIVEVKNRDLVRLVPTGPYH
jgi:hypothetical protein